MNHSRNFLRLAVLPSALGVLLSACGSEPSENLVTAQGAALHQAVDCPDLLAQIQADAVAKLDQQVALLKQDADGGRFTRPEWGADDVMGNDSSGTPNASPGGAGGTTGAEDGDSPGISGPSQHSETNTQVQGVDEADIVKFDGSRIFLVQGSEFFVLSAWPADQTQITGQAKVAGRAIELFVQDEKAVIFSRTSPPELTDKSRGNDSVPPDRACWDCWGGSQFTQISIYDVKGDVPVLEKEWIFEGDYVSGRRHGDFVRTVVRGGFKAPSLYSSTVERYDSFGRKKDQKRYEEELDQWRDRVAQDIHNTQLDDWIPRRFERKGSKWVPLSEQCDSYFAPEPGRVQMGVTQVVTLDWKKAGEPRVVAVLGGADTVYASQGNLVLGQQDYNWQFDDGGAQQTVLHQFSLKDEGTLYQASGFVPGYLHNQFSLDEREDVIRVATTIQSWARQGNETENRVYTLQAVGSELKILGKTPAFGEPGERIFSTRFLGERAYVVTFRQVDPLVAIDLSDVKNPRVLGELKIPGFSDYIHPLGENELLTIGQDADEGGMVQGIALQIFDVSDVKDMQLKQKKVLSQGSYSLANSNHKAFTFLPEQLGEGRGLLLFPLVDYREESRASLEVYEVSSTEGFKQLGSIDHSQYLLSCENYEEGGKYCYSRGQMQRGLYAKGEEGEFIYAVSSGAVTAHPLAHLDETLAEVELPESTPGEWGWGWADGGMSVGGSTGDEVSSPELD